MDENEYGDFQSSPSRTQKVVSDVTNNALQSEVLKTFQQSPQKRMMSFTNTELNDDVSHPVNLNSPLKRSINSCNSPKMSSPKKKSMRMLPTGPYKILDAPGE